jgi:hypothetical protein
MNPAPSPDTVEPTEADLELAGNIDQINPSSNSEVLAAAILIRRHVDAEVSRETAELREALSEISAYAHCLAKAGPLNTPTLDDAWMHFTQLSVAAAAALRPTAHKSSPPPPAS